MIETVDVNNLKGRIAEALVESIFRRALYRVARIGRESQVQGLVKVGKSELAPDFLVWKQVADAGSDRHLHRLLTIEVKYRSSLIDFIRKDIPRLVSEVRYQWPDLYCIVVTDDRDNSGSCFQIVDLGKASSSGNEPIMRDLHELRQLDIFQTTVEEYEGLVTQIFALLNAYGRDDSEAGTTQEG